LAGGESEIELHLDDDGPVPENQHIPIDYLRGSETQRRDLLAGLLDTGGTVAATGEVRFTAGSSRLAEEVRELTAGLGYVCLITGSTIEFSTSDDVFRLERKRIAHKERRSTTHPDARLIVDVRRVPSVPVRCVSVDNAEHLFLAGW